MSDTSGLKVHWQAAPDRALKRAAGHLGEYSEEEVEVIKAELRRRRLVDPDEEARMSDYQRSSATNSATGFAPFDPARQQYKLYSLVAIDIATFMGSLVAGSFLLAANFRNLGNSDSSRNVIFLGLTAFAAFAVAVIWLPALEMVPDELFYLLQVAAAHMYGHWKQGEALGHHASAMGSFYSKWRAAGIGLLATPLALGIFFLSAVLTVPEAENIEVSIDSPTAVEQGVRFEIQVRVRNTADSEQTLVDLDIADEYLTGITIVRSDPRFSQSEHLPFDNTISYSYDLEIPPGKELSITLFAHAAHQGEYAGYFSFCINSEVSCLFYGVRTIVE